MEHLFLKGVVKSGNKTLLKITDKTLKELLEELNTWNVILWEKGKPVNLVDFFKTRKNKKLAVMIGAFPHGDFKSSLKLSNEKISIGKESYSAAWALAKVIFSFEQALGI
jgi:rRNA pseudouridine-1189 N-methylase Emg1 (Nep1/Mra1 family)